MRHFHLSTVFLVRGRALFMFGYGFRDKFNALDCEMLLRYGELWNWDFIPYGFRSIKTGALIVSRSSISRFARWCFYHGYFRLFMRLVFLLGD